MSSVTCVVQSPAAQSKGSTPPKSTLELTKILSEAYACLRHFFQRLGGGVCWVWSATKGAFLFSASVFGVTRVVGCVFPFFACHGERVVLYARVWWCDLWAARREQTLQAQVVKGQQTVQAYNATVVELSGKLLARDIQKSDLELQVRQQTELSKLRTQQLAEVSAQARLRAEAESANLQLSKARAISDAVQALFPYLNAFTKVHQAVITAHGAKQNLSDLYTQLLNQHALTHGQCAHILQNAVDAFSEEHACKIVLEVARKNGQHVFENIGKPAVSSASTRALVLRLAPQARAIQRSSTSSYAPMLREHAQAHVECSEILQREIDKRSEKDPNRIILQHAMTVAARSFEMASFAVQLADLQE